MRRKEEKASGRDKEKQHSQIISLYILKVQSEEERPYHDDSTASRLLSEVKHRRARLVLRWGTTLESLVLFFFFIHIILLASTTSLVGGPI